VTGLFRFQEDFEEALNNEKMKTIIQVDMGRKDIAMWLMHVD
jgi:hypothetical protein